MRGLFTGKYSEHTQFQKDDTRKKDKNFIGDNLTKHLRFVEMLKKVATTYEKSLSQAAIRWVLDNTNVMTAIVGAVNAEQIEENIGALHWSLSDEDYHYITHERE
jgi:aryl-alcohol dehydrogenase-like predicted oxidoreductase